MSWKAIDTCPAQTRAVGTYLAANMRGQVAPVIRGVIHNNPGQAGDWEYGCAISHWMPLPAAPNTDASVNLEDSNADS